MTMQMPTNLCYACIASDPRPNSPFSVLFYIHCCYCISTSPRMSVQEVGEPEQGDVHEHEAISLLSQPSAAESDSEVSSIDRRGSEASSCFRPSEPVPDNEQRRQMVPGTELPSLFT